MRVFIVALLASVTLLAAAQPEPQHWYKPGRPDKPDKPDWPQNAIVYPKDFVKAWQNRDVPEYINPCLVLTVPYSKDYAYAPGFDLMWFSGYRTIRQFLQWNKKYDGTNRDDITLYVAGAQGFIGAPGVEEMLFMVWNQCAVESATKLQRQVPMPAYFADYILTKYGIEVPDQVLRQVIYEYWPDVHNELYGINGSNLNCSRACLGTTPWANATIAATETCGCNTDLISEFKRFAKADPSTSTPEQPTPTTHQCLKLLTANSTGARLNITIHTFRAAVNYCFNASPLQTGNGLGWRPPTGDGYNPGFFQLLSFPEYVQPNYSARKLLRMKSGLVTLSVL